MKEIQNAFERAADLKDQVKDDLLSKANVIGVGIGYKRVGGQRTDQVSIVVLVTHKVPADTLASPDLIPLDIEGFPVDVQEIGKVEIQE